MVVPGISSVGESSTVRICQSMSTAAPFPLWERGTHTQRPSSKSKVEVQGGTAWEVKVRL